MTGAAGVGFPVLVQDFFLRRLVQQRGASARTVESYRDALRLLITFAGGRTGTAGVQAESSKRAVFQPGTSLRAS